MAFPRFADMEARLKAMGAVELDTNTQDLPGGDRQTLSHYRFGSHILRLSHTTRDGIGCSAALAKDVEQAKTVGFRSVFELTVPGFGDFDVDQKVGWVLSVPKDERYIAFLADHVAKLPGHPDPGS